MTIYQNKQTLVTSILTQGDTGTPSVIKILSYNDGLAYATAFAVNVWACDIDEDDFTDADNATIAPTTGKATTVTTLSSTKELTLRTPSNVKATQTLTLTGVVIDGETVTYGTRVYEFDTDGNITVGNVSTDISGGATASQGTLTIPTLPTIGDTITVGSRSYALVADGTANAEGEIGIGVAAVAQIEVFTTIPDVASNLDGTYMQLSDEDGTVGVWIDVGDTGTTIPAGASALDRGLECTGISADDTANAVATAIASTINGDSKFAASAVGPIVTVTHATAGNVGNGAAGTTVFTTFAVSTPGVDLTCHAQIVAAINGTDGWNTANVSASFAAFASGTNVAIVTAKVPGTAGDAIVSTETFAAGGNVFDAATLGTETAGVDCIAATAITALAAAVTGDGSAVVTAVDGAGDTVVATAVTTGTTGNSLASTETMANGSFAAATLTGGVNEVLGEIQVTVTNATAEEIKLRFGMARSSGLACDYAALTQALTHAAP